MPEHDFRGGERCFHCGTLKTHHENIAQPCVPRWTSKEPLRPEPARHQYASESFHDIGERVAELEAERTAAMNEPAKD